MKAAGSTMPTCVRATIAALHAERAPLAARLDAIELAVDNLRRMWPEPGAEKNGGGGGRNLAEHRRDVLVSLIGSAPEGCTPRALAAATPTMKSGDRSNALQKLKAGKQIRKHGQVWVLAS